jgi:hypothetical protein
VDRNAQHGEPQLTRTVAERRLALSGGEIADPAGVVHTAEAQDRLLHVRRLDDHRGGRRSRCPYCQHRQCRARRQQRPPT